MFMKRNLFLRLCLMMAVVLSTFSCRQEIDMLANPDSQTDLYNFNKDNVKTRILNKKDFEKTEFLKAGIGMVSGFLKNQKNGNTSSKSTQIISGYEVYTDTYEEVSYLDAKYHSFYIIGDEQNGYEEKLVVKSINGQITDQHILRYKRKQDFSIDPTSYQTLKLENNTSSKLMFIDTFSMGCSTYTTVSYECGYTGHHTNGQYCSVLGVNMPHNTVSVIFEAGCTGSSYTGGSGTGVDGGGGGGSPNAPYTPPVVAIPTEAPLYTTHGPKGTTCNSLGLNTEEINQINSNGNLRLRIYQFIVIETQALFNRCEADFYSDEFKDKIKLILKYFRDHPNATWEEFNNTVFNPCQKIKATVNKPQIQDSLIAMKAFAQTSLTTERGFQELKSGTLLSGTVTKKLQVEFGIGPNSLGTIHVHPLKGIAMFSAGDIVTFLHLLREQDASTLGNAYGGMVSASGTYFINFTGTASDIPPAMTEIQEEVYIENLVENYITDKNNLLKLESKIPGQQLSNIGLEKLFFNLLSNMGLDGKISLIKEENGNTSTIQKDSNGNPVPNPC
jgi:hypothetical protein